MNVPLSTPKQRIIAALAVSLIVHAIFLWMPNIELPSASPELPPLMAKLEPIVLTKTPLNIKKKNKTPIAPKPVSAPPEAVNPTKFELPAEISAAETERLIAANETAIARELDAASSVVATSERLLPPPTPLPKHALLKFEVRKGAGGIAAASMQHTLDIDEDGQYKIVASAKMIGLAKLFYNGSINQSSLGTTDGQRLHPRQYTEEKFEGNTTSNRRATFDLDANQMIFTNGSQTTLTVDAQDMLSILYQSPAVPAEGDELEIAVTDGSSLDRYRFQVSTDETIITPMGKLKAIHYRKLHPPGEKGLGIWFAREYRNLPVKIHTIDPDGSVKFEFIITEIRVSDN
ncbi:MAG: hypothetical protein C0406_04385 [Sideroxydans sp.]|nr:hypothetical protein [Sideroxydans sp.]